MFPDILESLVTMIAYINPLTNILIIELIKL